jgi:phosphoserine phosphatase RsbU/P
MERRPQSVHWPIRWKLLALMWLLALAPVLLVAWVDINTLAKLGLRLATETGQALSDQTRLNLDQQADNYTRLTVERRRLVESLVRVQADAVERALLLDAPSASSSIWWSEDLTREKPAPSAQLSFHAAPGALRDSLVPEASRLADLRDMFGALRGEQSPLIQWQYVSLENGLHAVYPGHARYPPSFDPRLRPWYQTQKNQSKLQWSGPHRDGASRVGVLSASLPLYQNQQFIGVTGIDVPLAQLLPTPAANGFKGQIVLTALMNSPERKNQIEVVAHQKTTRRGRSWQETPSIMRFTTDHPRTTAALATEMRAGRSGFMRAMYQGQETLIAYRHFDADNSYLLFLVPGALATRAAAAATEYALATTNRQIESLIPLAMLAAAIAAAVAFVAARAITGPIQQLSEAVERVAQGNFDVRVDIQTGDELETLGSGFNRMVPQIEAHAYMKNALVVAREVQQQLLPKRAPEAATLEFHGLCLYADETGGDYYDYLDLRSRGLPVIGVAIGDVSGHGVASALLMATARALLHDSAPMPDALGFTLAKLNHNLADGINAGRFMTLFLLLFDLKAQEITWASAGHDPVLGYRAQNQSNFELLGYDIPLGVDRQWQYGATKRLPYLEGDVFLLATDGVWEAQSPTGERFGKERLQTCLRRFAHLSAHAISIEISRAIEAFRATAPARDDLTMVVVKALASTPPESAEV